MYYDLVCFSHLRWDFVFQRPQHLLQRFASKGHRVFYVEEAVYDETPFPFYYIHTDHQTNVQVVVMHLPQNANGSAEIYKKGLIDQLISDHNIADPVLWYYAPMFLNCTKHLTCRALVYDCMDELSAFKFAPVELKEQERLLIQKADIMFTGGASLYEAKKHLHSNIYAFPSSIDKLHFGQARTIKEDPSDQQNIPHPRIGFFGVIDERLDIELLGQIAAAKPDWHFVLVGPVVKIDPAALPVASNLHYLGSKNYQELPAYLAGWNIAMMPFALNESTAFISPTKTPEFLAGGKPVISTPIRDVINPYGNLNLVRIAATAPQFIEHATTLLHEEDNAVWLKQVDDFLAAISWNNTWNSMSELIDRVITMKNTSSLNKPSPHV